MEGRGSGERGLVGGARAGAAGREGAQQAMQHTAACLGGPLEGAPWLWRTLTTVVSARGTPHSSLAICLQCTQVQGVYVRGEESVIQTALTPQAMQAEPGPRGV